MGPVLNPFDDTVALAFALVGQAAPGVNRQSKMTFSQSKIALGRLGRLFVGCGGGVARVPHSRGHTCASYVFVPCVRGLDVHCALVRGLQKVVKPTVV